MSSGTFGVDGGFTTTKGGQIECPTSKNASASAAGLSEVYWNGSDWLRVNLRIADINVESASWNIDAWGGTIMQTCLAIYVALPQV
jgi:hypothetical protein